MTTYIIPQIRVEHKSVLEHRKVFNLERLAYVGGASVLAASFERAFERGDIGELIESRVEVLESFKELCNEQLASGKSLETVKSRISCFHAFIEYCDSSDSYCLLSIGNLDKAVLLYCDSLVARVLDKNDKLKKITAYNYGKNICSIATRLLNRPYDLLSHSRLKKIYTQNSKKAVSKSADKTLKKNMQKFGSILLDLMTGITKEGVTGSLPLKLPIRNALIEGGELLIYGLIDKDTPVKAAMLPEDYVQKYMKDYKGQYTAVSRAKGYISRMQARLAPNNDLMQAQRYSIYNYRIQAELRMFIALTQGNLQPVISLKRQHFEYKPMGDFYQVRNYKNRAGGNVIFEIHKAYKSYFESYLAFRDDFVATYPMENDDLLFPFYCPAKGNGVNDKSIYSQPAKHQSFKKKIFTDNKLPWINNKDLREGALNILHQHTGDDDLTAEQACHSVNTFKKNYERPSLHKANIEVTRFWSERDPIKGDEIRISVIQSQCDHHPKVAEGKPSVVAEPNCISPSACLWCDKYRDVDSFEYIWSLVSFRYLKRVESALVMSDKENPIDLAIGRINEKLKWFREAKPEYQNWVNEAELRVDEEQDFHPFWNTLIEVMES
jgi:hypothetical protein